MARYGLLSDIHGNLEALTASIAALERAGARQFLCLGDVIGYNADSDECAALVRSRCAMTIAGNHDLIGTHRLGFGGCSNAARYSLRRTRRTLGHDAAAWLGSLPPSRTLEGGKVVLVHAGVRDVQQFMQRGEQVRENAEHLRYDFPGAKLCFFGHSHRQLAFEVDGNVVHALPFKETMELDREKLYFVYPGSVDAQRKHGRKLAECALFDSLDWSVESLRVPYDAASTEAKAAVFGYRITALTNRYYDLRRRLLRAA
ncbi:MAG: metallophosphoesterase family protein [Clostridia bacterium]